MAILAGIDEAGFGPILGPLVVSSTAFSLPKSLLEKDLWQILKRSLANRRKHLAGRLLVADSKKAYSKSLGIKHLERTVLASVMCIRKKPANAKELLSWLCPQSLERLSGYPWYQNYENRSFSADITDLEIASQVFKDDMAANEMELLDIASCCLDVGYYNKRVKLVKNKSSVLFTATCQLIEKMYKAYSDRDLQIIIDRQGGRVKYRKVLLKMFGDMDLKILMESNSVSSYELRTNSKTMRLHFVVGADDKFLAVSLASMVSKLVRQLLVENINRYFTNLYGDLQPTAGYWKDGLRFIKEVKSNVPNTAFDDSMLIRSR